jgi:transposase
LGATGLCERMALFPQNLGSHLSIDETSLSRGELYTILTNKAAKGGKGSIVAGTKAETVIEIIRKIPEAQRKKVTEITLDMAGSMGMIAKRCFPRATRVTNRFQIQQLATEALQEIRINTVGKHWSRKMTPLNRPKQLKQHLNPRFYLTEIRLNNCWSAADMHFIKSLIRGLQAQKKS